MYIVKYTNQFKRDWKLCKKRGLPMELLQTAITILAQNGTLPPEYKPHKLTGNRVGECRKGSEVLGWQVSLNHHQ